VAFVCVSGAGALLVPQLATPSGNSANATSNRVVE
jgi:hypothetical protein